MHFSLVDRVLEHAPGRIVTMKHVSAAEEYLQDHFPSFPVLPGVMMLECMVQAGRLLAQRESADALADADGRWVLGKVRALKYGRFVKPGSTLRVEVSIAKPTDDGTWDLKGEAILLDPASPDPDPAARPVAVSGRFTLRRLRIAPPPTLPAPLQPQETPHLTS